VHTNARQLLAICLATWAWSFSFGLGTQVTSHWLKARDAALTIGPIASVVPLEVGGDTFIGLTHSAYYLGLALGSLAVPRLIGRLGHLCTALGMIASGVTLAVFPWASGPGGWLMLRFINGAGGALSLVPLETLVSRDSAPEEKTRNFSFYGVALTLGGAIGIWGGLHFYRPGDTLAFSLGGLLPICAGLIFVRVLPPSSADQKSPPPAQQGRDWRRQVLSYGTAWFQGFLEGGMLAFLSLYLVARGLSRDAAGGLMSVTLVGVIAFQVPVGWLADRYGRRGVLLACYLGVAGGLVLVPLGGTLVWLAVCLFFLGGCSGALYPVALALLGDRLAPTALARAYACFMAMECVGSQLGAAAMGQARDWWGEDSMFAMGLAALASVLVITALSHFWRRARPRPALGSEEALRAA
jgi:MFS family permease